MNPINHILSKGQMETMLDGIKQAESVLAASYGSRPGNAMFFGQDSGINVFDDGYQALSRYNPEDVHHRMGKSLVLDASAATFRQCGDGTSTTGILAAQLMLGYNTEKHDEAIAKDVEENLAVALDYIGSVTTNVDEDLMFQVAMTAMHGDAKMAKIVSDIVWQVGQSGIITADMSKSGEVYAEKSLGIETKGGFPDPSFTNRGGNMVVNEARLLFINSSVSDIKHEFWEYVFSQMKSENFSKPLVVVCLGASGAFLQTFIDNRDLNMFVAKVDSPTHLKYIADVFGAKVHSDTKGILRHERVVLSELPVAPQVKCTKDKTSILPSPEHSADMVISKIELLIAAGNQTEDDEAAIAMLNSTFGTIYVPYQSQSQFSALKEQVEDGYNACMQAFQGVISGQSGKHKFFGGYWLYTELSNLTNGRLREALHQLALYVNHNEEDAFVPVDCASTLKTALKNAVGVAVPFLKTRTFIANEY